MARFGLSRRSDGRRPEATLIVVAAGVWLSSLVHSDERRGPSRDWLATILAREIEIAEPAPFLVEIAGAVARQTGLSHLGAGVIDRATAGDRGSASRKAREVHRLTGFCLLHTREVLERIGFLDENFGLGCYEDFDYCVRIRQAGLRLVVAQDVFIHHHGGAAFKENGLVASSAARRNRDLFLEKWRKKSLARLQ